MLGLPGSAHKQVCSQRCASVSSQRRASEWCRVKCSDSIVVSSLDPLPYKQVSDLSTKPWAASSAG